MNEEQFLKIMSDDDLGGEKMFVEGGCNAVRGLLLIQKYLPKSGIEGASHDVIWACDVDKLIEAGITEEDAIELRKENWMVEEDLYLACFV